MKSDLRNLSIAEDTFLHSGADRYGTIGRDSRQWRRRQGKQGSHVERGPLRLADRLLPVGDAQRIGRHLVLRQPGRGHSVACRHPVPRYPSRNSRRPAAQQSITHLPRNILIPGRDGSSQTRPDSRYICQGNPGRHSCGRPSVIAPVGSRPSSRLPISAPECRACAESSAACAGVAADFGREGRVRMISRRVRELQRRRAVGDQGFAMVELMVAMVVFALLAAGVLASLNMANATGRGNRLRVVGGEPGGQPDRDRAQSRRLASCRRPVLPDGRRGPAVRQDDGRGRRLLRPAERRGRTDRCARPRSATAPPGAKLGYKRITVQVTWDTMGTIQPVRSDTLMTLGANGPDPNKANIAVKVRDRNALPQDAVLVSISPGGVSQQTGYDGCVVFTNLNRGTTYTTTLNTTGYVDPNGVATPAQSVVIPSTGTANQVYKVAFDYDQSSRLSLTVNTQDATYPVPSALLNVLPVTLGSTTLWATTSYRKLFLDCTSAGATAGACITPTGTPRQLPNLYPIAYSAWSGACSDADPGQSSRPAPIVLTPGQTITGAVDTEASQDHNCEQDHLGCRVQHRCLCPAVVWFPGHLLPRWEKRRFGQSAGLTALGWMEPVDRELRHQRHDDLPRPVQPAANDRDGEEMTGPMSRLRRAPPPWRRRNHDGRDDDYDLPDHGHSRVRPARPWCWACAVPALPWSAPRTPRMPASSWSG